MNLKVLFKKNELSCGKIVKPVQSLEEKQVESLHLLTDGLFVCFLREKKLPQNLFKFLPSACIYFVHLMHLCRDVDSDMTIQVTKFHF